MKIALVSSFTRPYALGLRYVSSYLKSAGHDVEMVFMSAERDTSKADFGPALREDFTRRLQAADLIGVALMTNSFLRAAALTRFMKEDGVKAPIVWGGVHPTIAPEECLEHADAVCVGEGEEPMRQLAQRLAAGEDSTDIAGLWLRGGGPFGNAETVRNAPGPLMNDLDSLPFPDYELDTHWIAERDRLVRARPENLRGALETFSLIATRGCPYHCAFCNNTALKRASAGKGKWVRLRSLDNVLEEIRQALACFPSMRSVHIVDDLFFVHKADEIEDFAVKYDAEVGLPLLLEASPNTVTEQRMQALTKAPVKIVVLGIQSASKDTLRNIYQRPTAPKRIAEAMNILAKYKVRTELHYIVSNPYEPEENVIETMRFIASHHRRAAVLRVFPLLFFPSTPLYDRARADGLIDDRHELAYTHVGTHARRFTKQDYLAVWLRIILDLRNAGMPSWAAHRIIDVATNRLVRKVLDRRWFGPTVMITYKIAHKAFKNLVYQPFIRPFKYFRRPPRRREARLASKWTVRPVGA
ncbi:MAG: B12-binding domain-containing radical SAM protein [Phycisphaerae bacterium]|nr:B12-binding domain-containing radical SAM protein [Phycisphaerae bacterium]